MARTAPVPNMAAIPGMNPGLFVMGGGAGDGAGGAGGGNGSASGQGANGQNGGNGANGGGNGTGACGQGTSTCPGPHGPGGGAAAGDPIDVASGAVSTGQVDLELPGPLRFELRRTYDSALLESDVGLGKGWTHSFAWRVEERRGSILLYGAAGGPRKLHFVDGATVVRLEGGSFVERVNDTYVVHTTDQKRLVLAECDGAGTFRLRSVLDYNGNRIELVYDRGLLHAMLDSAGRVVRVRWNSDGRIRAFEVRTGEHQAKWVSFHRYDYDANGRLVGVLDAKDFRTAYEYDSEHRLVAHLRPSGIRTVWAYDDAGRCVETWVDHHERPDPALDPSARATLADGSPAKGMFHCRVHRSGPNVEVVDSAQVRRCEVNDLGLLVKATLGSGVITREFDVLGNMTSFTDQAGATTLFRYNAHGATTEIVDPLGRMTSFEYDDQNLNIRTNYPDGSFMEIQYDERRNTTAFVDALGLYQKYVRDHRGLPTEAHLPNGGVAKMDYDPQGNRIRVVEPDGATKTIDYDYLGRPVRFRDAVGRITSYVWDERGLLNSVQPPHGPRVEFEYDEDQRLVATNDAAGRPERYRWGGLNVVYERVSGGRIVRYGYDREQRMVRIVDEAGAEHVIERNLDGLVMSERTFDGRQKCYRYDASGRITEILVGRETTTFEWDDAGQLLAREFGDGTRQEYEYDGVGRLVRATTPECEVTWTRDARGRIVRETQMTNGEAHEVCYAFDSFDSAVERRSSLGLHERTERDLLGRVTRVSWTDEAFVAFRFAPDGLEVERLLPRGASIRSRHDDMTYLAERSLFGPDGRPRRIIQYENLGTGEPASMWEREPRGERSTEWRYDEIGQLVARKRGDLEVRFRYGAAGELVEEGGLARTYGPGGRLERVGDVAFRYDECGRVISRNDAKDDARSWRYTWNGANQLVSARRGDGLSVEYRYDALSRRISGRVTRPSAAPVGRRFVWDGATLLHELRQRSAEGGDPIVEERTYIWDDDRVPIAARTVRREGGNTAADAWTYFFNDHLGAPQRVVDGSGATVEEIDLSPWGEAAGPLDAVQRFPGHFADEETGLHYNHFRYYDPRLGVYLTPEPLGVDVSLRGYAYAHNRPSLYVDPDGLAPTTVTLITSTGPVTGQSTNGYRQQQQAENRRAVREGRTPNQLPTHQSQGPASLPTDHPHPPGFQGPNDCAEVDAINRHLANGGSVADIQEIRINNRGRYIPPCAYCTQRLAAMSLASGTNLFHAVRGPNGEAVTPLATNRQPQEWYRGEDGSRTFPDPRQPFRVDPTTGAISDRNGNLLMS